MDVLQLSGTKTYYALAAEVAASSLPALQAGRLVAFEVRIEPDFLGALLVYCSPLGRNPSDCRGLTSQIRTSGETVKFHLSGKCVNGPEQSATDANYRRTRATNGGGGTRSAGAMPHHTVPKVHRATI